MAYFDSPAYTFPFTSLITHDHMAQALAQVKNPDTKDVEAVDAEQKRAKVDSAETDVAEVKSDAIKDEATKYEEAKGEKASDVKVKGCHLVGSGGLQFESTESFMRAVCAAMPDRLKRIPDGETGERHMFTLFQYKMFLAAPECLVVYVKNAAPAQHDFTEQQIEEGVAKLKKAEMNTGYDDVAVAGFSVFEKLRHEGVIPKDCKYQVSIPSIANVLSPLVQRDFQAHVAPIYEAALFRAVRRIQDEIPHEDLCIQVDLAVDTAFWEGVLFKPWFGTDVKANVVGYVTRMVGNIGRDVELGIHYCFGDMEHKHWAEPASLAGAVELGTRLLQTVLPHSIGYFHTAVPKSAMGHLDAFLAPLADFAPKLKAQGGELYLGVVQYDDLEGTKKRIEGCSKIVSEFGVATECGWGRTPSGEVDDIMEISKKVSQPVF